jgi:all-trans-retinol 13,14-reductase
MSYDAIVIGAGMGGLLCAAKLAANGKTVLVLEKIQHIGGTSFIFKRGGYFFPMGPLGFSFPQRVKDFLEEAGVQTEVEFKRNYFELLTPDFDIIYSQPFQALKENLKEVFPEESEGIDIFIGEIEKISLLIENLDRWHPDFLLGRKKRAALENKEVAFLNKLELIKHYSEMSAATVLSKLFSNEHLKNLLGSQGTFRTEMSMLHLAFMWKVMSEKGIWFPSCRIDGIAELLKDAFLAHNGEMRLSAPVKEILIEDNHAVGVRTAKDEMFEAEWVISNADYKKTFLELIDPLKIPKDHLGLVRTVPYTGSEFCIYLGVDPKRVDLSRMRANHLFFRKEVKPEETSDPEDFDNREIEICLWSQNAPDSAPEGRTSLIVRVDFPYGYFSNWRIGEKRRREGYRERKKQLAQKLIRTVESALPGLATSIEVMEIATPLTYEDWGQRFRGSIAGWTRSAELARRLPGKLLIETSINNLLMVGIYAATELFLGGVSTAMHTASLAADLVLKR